MKLNKLAIVILALSALMVFTSCAPKMPDKAMEKESDKQVMVEEKVEKEMAEEIKKEEPVPDYMITTFDGEKVNLFDNQKTYVKVWASWCSVCLSGLDEYNDLAGSDTDFRVLNLVAPGNFGELSKADLKEWWSGLQADYPNMDILLDMDGQFFTDMGVRAFPTSVYIDSNNEVVDVVIGHNPNDFILDKMNGIE